MSKINPKKIITTDTDLYLNLLADDTKIKEQLPQKLTVVNENTSEDDEHVVDALNLEGTNNLNNLKFQQTDKAPSEKSNEDDYDSDDDYSHSDKSSKSSRSSRSSKSVKPVKSVAEVKNNVYEVPFDQLPPQQQRLKRLEKFMQLKYIKEKFSISLSKEYTINSDYNEMCAEIEFHTNFQKRRNGVEFWKSTFVYGAKGCEYLNKMFDPFGFDLNGWGDHFSSIDANSNDEIFGELYDKYKSKFDGYSVEFRAILMFAGSAGAFVTANSISNVPGMNKIKETNPDLFNKIRANVANVTKSKVAEMTGGKQTKDINEQNQMYQKMQQEKRQMEMALESQRKEMVRMQENQQRIIEKQQSENNALKNNALKSNALKQSAAPSISGNTVPLNSRNIKPSPLNPTSAAKPIQPTMTGSSNINSILNKLKQNLPKNDETSSVVDADSSDNRVLMSSTVDSEKIKNVSGSIKKNKQVLNIRK
jgi:hypothetical protein